MISPRTWTCTNNLKYLWNPSSLFGDATTRRNCGGQGVPRESNPIQGKSRQFPKIMKKDSSHIEKLDASPVKLLKSPKLKSLSIFACPHKRSMLRTQNNVARVVIAQKKALLNKVNVTPKK